MLLKCEWVMGKLPVKGRDCRKHGDRLPAGARAMLNHCRRCRVLLQIRSAFWLLRANCAFAGCCQVPAASPIGFSASLAALGAVRRRCVWCVPPLLLYGGELCGMEMASSLALPCPGPGCWKAASLALHAATTVGGWCPILLLPAAVLLCATAALLFFGLLLMQFHCGGKFFARNAAIAVGIQLFERGCIGQATHLAAVFGTLADSGGAGFVELGFGDFAVTIQVKVGKSRHHAPGICCALSPAGFFLHTATLLLWLHVPAHFLALFALSCLFGSHALATSDGQQAGQ